MNLFGFCNQKPKSDVTKVLYYISVAGFWCATNLHGQDPPVSFSHAGEKGRSQRFCLANQRCACQHRGRVYLPISWNCEYLQNLIFFFPVHFFPPDIFVGSSLLVPSATLHLCLLLLPLLVSRWMFQLLIGSRITLEPVIYDLAGPFKTALGRIPLAVMFWFPTANIA